MDGTDCKYIRFHHQDNWNAEHCKGGRIKRKSLTKTADMMQCAGLLRLKAAHCTSPLVTVRRSLELRKLEWEYPVCVLFMYNYKVDES